MKLSANLSISHLFYLATPSIAFLAPQNRSFPQWHQLLLFGSRNSRTRFLLTFHSSLSLLLLIECSRTFWINGKALSLSCYSEGETKISSNLEALIFLWTLAYHLKYSLIAGWNIYWHGQGLCRELWRLEVGAQIDFF